MSAVRRRVSGREQPLPTSNTRRSTPQWRMPFLECWELGVRRWALRSGPVVASLVILLVSLGICEAAVAAEPIPESEIIALQKKLASPGDSRVATRRTMKNIARKARALLKEAPEAPNRFAVLGIMFRAQTKLLAQANTERNREALFATCEKLAKAPDEYAEHRLEADLLLSERELSDKDATLAERAEALAEVVERYKGTSAEAKRWLRRSRRDFASSPCRTMI